LRGKKKLIEINFPNKVFFLSHLKPIQKMFGKIFSKPVFAHFETYFKNGEPKRP